MNIKSNSSTGYILEEDLEYPQELLHDVHNDYSLAPEKINIPKEFLSDYSVEIAYAHNISTEKVKKLVPNLLCKLKTLDKTKRCSFTCNVGFDENFSNFNIPLIIS